MPDSEFLGGDSAFIQAAVPSTDGRRLGILTTDGSVMVWQLAPRVLLGRWIMPGPRILNQSSGTFPMALDEAGEHVAIASTDGHVRVWQVDPPLALGGFVPTPPSTIQLSWRRQPTGRGDSVMTQVATLWGPIAAGTVAFAPGRSQLTVGGARGMSTWDVRSMSPMDSMEFGGSDGHSGKAVKLAYVPDGTLLVGTEDGIVRRFNARTRKEEWRQNFGLGNPHALVTSPWGGLFAVSGMLDSNVVVANAGLGTVVCRQRVDVVDDAVFSPDHGLLLLASSDGIVVINPQECRSMRGSVTGIHGAAGVWFDAACEHAYLASRFSHMIRVYALPRKWRC
jgi:WD40 repeat protein